MGNNKRRALSKTDLRFQYPSGLDQLTKYMLMSLMQWTSRVDGQLENISLSWQALQLHTAQKGIKLQPLI
eukprot:12561619-Ditylum_brightwellii.AAC.1